MVKDRAPSVNEPPIFQGLLVNRYKITYNYPAEVQLMTVLAQEGTSLKSFKIKNV